MWIWGIVGAVIVLASIGAALLYNRASKRRCPHCRALVPKSATTCPHCTGALQEYLQEAKEEETHRKERED